MSEIKTGPKLDPLDELEKIFSDIASGKLAPTKAMASLSGIEPATDPVASSRRCRNEDDEAPLREMATLRDSIEDLKTHLATAMTRADKLDRDLDLVVQLAGSARQRINAALAIAFLQKHDRSVLVHDADDRLSGALTMALADLETAEIKADRIPF